MSSSSQFPTSIQRTFQPIPLVGDVRLHPRSDRRTVPVHVRYWALSVDYSQGTGTTRYEYDVLQQRRVLGSTPTLLNCEPSVCSAGPAAVIRRRGIPQPHDYLEASLPFSPVLASVSEGETPPTSAMAGGLHVPLIIDGSLSSGQ